MINLFFFSYEWKEDSGGSVPKHAIVAGIAEDGEPLYVCKAKINGEKCVGKVSSFDVFQMALIWQLQTTNAFKLLYLDSQWS